MTDNGKLVDDQELLDQMVNDWQSDSAYEESSGGVHDLYTNFVDDLTSLGLAGCIDNRVRGVTAINGCDAHPTRAPHAKLDMNDFINAETKSAVRKTLDLVYEDREAPILPYDLSLADLDDTAFRLCELSGQIAGVRPLSEFKMSDVLKPEYTFTKNGNQYSYPVLYSYLHYVNCARHVDFEEVENIIEIGPGAGRQVEVIRKFHPHINFYLLDVAPTLYFCERFLSATFPDAVIPYRDIREQEQFSIEGVGRIAHLGHGKIENLRPVGQTLSFNTAVFCLMSPVDAERYFRQLMTLANMVYVCEPKRPDCTDIYGIAESACLDDIERFLAEEFDLLESERAIMPLGYKKGFGDFHSAVWRRERDQQ